MIEEKIIEVMDKLESVLTEYSPQAWDLMVSATQIDGVLSFLFGVLLLLLCGSCIGMLIHVHKNKGVKESIFYCEDFFEEKIVFISIPLGVMAFVFLMFSLGNLLSSSTYLSIFLPEAAVIKQLLMEATNR